ncbi:MAG TPA: hypothetical protein VGQ62_18970, partial [Chloroflexota bacterium]|nr:hypothetical protein [Chloroflexota bacterium]
RAEHARREAKRRHDDNHVTRAASSAPPDTFSIALFSRIDRPAIERREATLAELTTLLSTFEGLTAKREGRCWSPTRYVDSAVSRGDAGVASLSCLVFDLDKVPPDPTRLGSLYWIAHTTWSHSTDAPRWRVVLPLSRPVPAADWRETWQRAHAALCPEADPSCKDPSREYYLPSFRRDGVPESTCHQGDFLEPTTLPPLSPPPHSRCHAECTPHPLPLIRHTLEPNATWRV